MIKSNKNMLKLLVALAFTMSPVFAVAACNPSTKDDQAKLKTGDLNKLRIIAPEIEAFNNVKDKTAVTTDEITTVVNTIVKTAIDQIVTETNLKVDYNIKIEKDSKIITGTYDLTSKTALDRTFDITVIKTQTAKLKGIHKSQRIVFPELKGAEEVVIKADLSTLTNIDAPITVEATENTNTSADMIKTAVKKEVLKLVKNLPNGTVVEAADLDITVKKGNDNLTGDSIDLKDGLTLNVEIKASDAGKTKLEGEKTITVKIAKITPVVVKADLSKLEAIDSPITVEATESTNTSADMIKTAVKKEVLKLVKNLPNGTVVEAADLDITVKKGNDNLTGDSIDLKDGLTLNVEIKASDADAGKTKLEGEKTITVKIAKITPVVVKADLSKLEAIDSPITVEATENTNTSADMIKTAVKKEVLKLVKNLPNGTVVEAADLDITVKKGNDNLTGDSIDLKDGLTLNVEIKASDAGKTKLEGEKTITVKIAKITPVVVKADLSKLEAIDSPITVEATENTNTSADMIKTAVKKEVLKLVKNLPNGTVVEAADLDITVKKGNDNLTGDSIDLKDGLTLNVEIKASDAGKTKLEGEKTITVKIAKITPVVVKADLSKLEAIDSPITVEATESTNTSADMIKTAVKKEVLKLVKNLPNGTVVEAADLEITVKKENGTDDLDATTSLATEITVSVTVKASDAGKTKLEGEKTITVKIAKLS
ncbi:hypothetical protein [Spiroplasma endosymbiont of Dromius quadrimaculatus]|uniref:hypothetical protein n=1 Tax=Spiroplasma endosymbiont of Dromius quadrimaculatus TaxID=3066283 RepID=UPI00313C41F8